MRAEINPTTYTFKGVYFNMTNVHQTGDRKMTDTTIKYDSLGQRVTSCCGRYSTYMDDGTGAQVLCCKVCYEEVPVGEGDGNEFREGVTAESYFTELFALENDPAVWDDHQERA